MITLTLFNIIRNSIVSMRRIALLNQYLRILEHQIFQNMISFYVYITYPNLGDLFIA